MNLIICKKPVIVEIFYNLEEWLIGENNENGRLNSNILQDKRGKKAIFDKKLTASIVPGSFK